MSTTLTIVVPGRVDPGLADDLASELGAYPRVEGTGEDRTVDVAMAAIVVYTAVHAFLSSMVQQFGVEAATRLTRVFDRLRSRSTAPEQEVRLVDEANLVTFVVGESACRDRRALVGLLELERDIILPGVELRWDAAAGRWTARGPDGLNPPAHA